MIKKIILALTLSAGMAGAIQPARADLFKPSVNEQIKLGLDAAAQLRKQSKVLPSTDERVKLVRAIGAQIIATFPKNLPWKFSFDVLDSKEVNAFAFPGGPMFFYTGLLDQLKTKDELAGVVGHELTHVLKEHWAYQQAAETKKNLFLTGALLIFHANRVVTDVASLASAMDSLRFSQNDEYIADKGGFDAVVASGYNPQGMIDLFNLLEKVGGKTPEILSDHPSNQHRIDRIKSYIAASGKTFPPQEPLPWAKDEPKVESKK